MRRGFTLLEVMLALGLMILLLGASMTFLWELSDRRATLSRGSRDLHTGVVLMERLEADLASGLVGDPAIGAGVQGTATRVKLLSRGVWLSPGAAVGGDGPASSGAAGGAGEGDLQASEYVFDERVGRLTARRFVVKPVGGSAAGTGVAMEVVSDRVERVRFRYYDGKGWVESFDSLAQGTLPVAVEVAVWFTALKNDRAPLGEEARVAEGERGDGEAAAAEVGETNEAAVDMDGGVEERRWPAPDRLRVIIVPDGPVSAWKEGA